MDQRIKTLAKNLINYSCKIQKGERVLIECIGDTPKSLAKALVEEAYLAGGLPFVSLKDTSVTRAILKGISEEQAALMAKYELERMKDMDAYIGIRGADNIAELSNIESKNMKIYNEIFMNPVHMNERVNNTKWVVLRYPNNSMAQLANVSLEEFEDFYFDVCNLDYSKMGDAMESLVNLLNRTDKVRITGSGTDLSFSIKDIPAVKCSGLRNIPDGEVYTAPVLDSVNGTITYNSPSVYQGTTFENITFKFENGKIIEATSNNTEKLNEILNIDNGARYIGEFAIGVNPYILKPMKDTLFDEKIAGSIHFTPGQAYEKANNGNKSSIHWDLVMIQRPEYGGGEIWFDDVLVRKDGIFVLEELNCLNPENLK
ncbi:MAG: aminopeptidase [Cetobacterium sp.]|uniref:aminopeptidase n=1 Tax=unclassified Cetobacterium TaxID=2630983 RepID=UPI00163C151C|nr:aminopeptidase [Cetobacterium sp. 2A]MBC2855722.1 aminopeptidase [Cetobacterium sp. 2A]